MNKRILMQRKAAALAAAKGLNDAAAAADRDLTSEELAQFEAHMAEASSLQARIERMEQLEATDMGVEVAADATITVEENSAKDPKRGFNSMGDFFKSVQSAAIAPHAMDKRLLIGAAAPGAGTYMNEGSGADGGYAIPPAFSTDIWRASLEDGSLLPMTANTEVTGNSMVFPKDETTPWSSDGVQAYWRGEAAQANASKPVLSTSMLRLHELMVLVPITNELLSDASALGSYLSPLASERIQWKTNEAILFGTGNNQPMGCLSSNALVTVAKETGQTAASIVQMNISKMRSRLKTGELKNAVWIGNPDILPQLESMTVGQIPIFLPPGTGLREGGYDGTLNGRPLILTEHANALGAQGDLSLVSLKGYRTITKAGGIQTDTSMHIYFDANATAFRFIFRLDGQPIMQKPITPPQGKSTNTRSYFVTLGAR